MKQQQATAIPTNHVKPLNKSKQHWQNYSDGHDDRSSMPEYLAKNYWWAYLSPIGVNIFDHPFIVNRILWGQYHKIANDTVKVLAKESGYSLAQISCAYGEIIPKVGAEAKSDKVYLFDVAPIQLDQARKKIAKNNTADKFTIFEANAEHIPLEEDQVDNSLLFFLLHELPAKVRKNVLREAFRITKSGGRLVIADYAPITKKHWFHKLSFFRYIFETLEPFLGNFWRTDLVEELESEANKEGKTITAISEKYYWHKFYRLLEFSIEEKV